MAESTGRYIVSIDQGTSSTKAIAVDEHGMVRATARRAISQAHPAPGHVEQDPIEILDSVYAAIDDVVEQLDGPHRVVAVGISSQRESAVIWERSTGRPLGPMLGWQDRRTTDAAEQIRQTGGAAEVRQRSGLPLDPMFSALKLSWLLDGVDLDRRRSRAGEIAVGTVDSWLVDSLTGLHRIEAGNASRTQLMNLASVSWDDALTDLFGIPMAALPTIARSDEATPAIRSGSLAGVPVTGILGDSHAALYAHGVRSPGSIKATYGTGSSVMGLVDGLDAMGDGLVSTIAWQTESTAYAGEGNVLATGAALVWLASILGVEPDELMRLAEENTDPAPVDLVPAVAGLGAPWWDERATALISGFDLGTSRSALAAAAADAVVLQIEDVVAAFDSPGRRCVELLVDGGPADNDWLVQRQADLSRRTIIRRADVGLSALGAAHLAGVSAGLYDGAEPLGALAERRVFEPSIDPSAAADRLARWHGAIRRARMSGEGTDVC